MKSTDHMYYVCEPQFGSYNNAGGIEVGKGGDRTCSCAPARSRLLLAIEIKDAAVRNWAALEFAEKALAQERLTCPRGRGTASFRSSSCVGTVSRLEVILVVMVDDEEKRHDAT